MPDNSILALDENHPATQFIVSAGVSASTGKVHAMVLKADGPDSWCGLGTDLEAAPFPVTIDCSRCVALITGRLASMESARQAELENPARLRSRISDLEAERAEHARRLEAVTSSATDSLRQLSVVVRAERQQALLWRSIAAAVIVTYAGTRSSRELRLSPLEAAAVRAGVPWAEMREDEEDGSMIITAFLSHPAPAVSSGHGGSGGSRPGSGTAGADSV